MKLSLATNFDDNLIDLIKDYPVYELYGKLKEDMIGGGRPASSFGLISKENLENHVKKTRSVGIKFNYLLNGGCIGNQECIKEWQKDFRGFLDYLASINVNALTVSNPILLKIIKKYYDCFDVRISIFACVDSLEKALYWEDMGADYICADVMNINRNFDVLKKITQNLTSAKLELLANVSCLKSCPMIHTHANWNAHASNGDQDTNKFIDYCILYCQKKELEDASRYIKSGWIRPEDIAVYEKIGIEHFKLTERNIPTNELVKRVKAYSNRYYKGNLLDLVQGHGFCSSGCVDTVFSDREEFKKMDCKAIINLLSDIRGMGKERKCQQHVYIDNQKLKGFIQFFIQNRCTGNCKQCGYCKKISDTVITENTEIKKLMLELYNRFDENFI